jgi:hypothetical protein
MATTFEAMRDRLPTLYRPAEDDRLHLLPLFLRTVAAALDEVEQDAGSVMQGHWFAYADRALISRYFARARELQDLPLPTPEDFLAFPYIDDLSRIASILPLPPWRDPAIARETVEAYRERIRRTVLLYREGLGTSQAIRRMVEVQLPLAPTPAKQRDRPVWLEESASNVPQVVPVQPLGKLLDPVGPMMRWKIENPGLRPVTPTVYIQGLAPSTQAAATDRPLIELFQSGDDSPPLGIAYNATIEPETTLRLRPAFTSWLALRRGLQRADDATDPTAPGPWKRVTSGEAPGGAVAAVIQVRDRALWIGMDVDGEGELRRFDGQTWTVAVAGLSAIQCLAEDGQDLLIGTVRGLFRMSLYPQPANAFEPVPVADLDEQGIHALFRASDGVWWAGTDTGTIRIDSPDTVFLAGRAVFTINEDPTGTMFFGADIGLIQFQPTTGDWYWYEGKERTDQGADWQPLDLGALPAAEQVFLPPVHAVHRGSDASLWLGTERGIARYVARSVYGLTLQTVLEAFPELTEDAVFSITEDARGLIWFATSRGLFRYDGRDFWQFQRETESWLDLGRADTFYDAAPEMAESGAAPRGAWRFLRATATWQRSPASGRAWANVALAMTEPQPSDQPAVRSVVWTEGVVADLGTWDGSQFSMERLVEPRLLEMRFKPDPTRIVSGGIPAIPSLPPGASVWRYLSRESEDQEDPAERPAWTREGRLLPEPRASAPDSARFDRITPPASNFDETIFAFDPTARVWFEFGARQSLAVLVRLKKRAANEQIDPAIVDRVWQGIQQVRPAGVRAMLAVEETIVRGGDHGTG